MSQNRNSRPNKRTNRRNPNSPKRIDLSKRPNRTGRTGRSTQGSNQPAHKEHGLGGEQIEGRQAVRELLLGARRRVHEIWIANDIESSPVIDDILEIARDQRIQVMNVSRREIEREARRVAVLAQPGDPRFVLRQDRVLYALADYCLESSDQFVQFD